MFWKLVQMNGNLFQHFRNFQNKLIVMRSFLGFSGYYRSFIKDYSRLTSQMNQLKTTKDVQWTEQAKRDFEELRQCFAKAPVHGFPMYYSSEPFLLDTDWSAINMAAI